MVPLASLMMFTFVCVANSLPAESPAKPIEVRYKATELLCYEFPSDPDFASDSDASVRGASLLPDKAKRHYVRINCESFHNGERHSVGFMQNDKHGNTSIKNQFVVSEGTIEDVKEKIGLGDKYEKVKSSLKGFMIGDNWGIMRHDWHVWIKKKGSEDYQPAIIRGYFKDTDKANKIAQWRLIGIFIWIGRPQVASEK